MKIPKIIYSTWISHKPLPDRFNKYIESWKKFLPEYEIRMITMDNVPHNNFTDHFIENKKYAVAAQYARCQRIFETGGLYFDIDIEVVRDFDELLEFEMFAGIESDEVEHYVNNAIFGAAKENLFMQDCLRYMDNVDFSRKDIEVGTGPLMFTSIMKTKGWIPANKNSYYSSGLWNHGINQLPSSPGIQLFNSKYFYPYFYTEQFKPDCITKETYAIHHWAATWLNSVSVIIFCNRQTEFLAGAIESSLDQTIKAIEIIVVNCGDQKNKTTLHSIAKKYKVKFIEAEYDNVSDAMNTAIDFAKGKWIVSLNANERLVPDFIERTIDRADIVGIYLTGTSSTNAVKRFTLFKKEVWEKLRSDNNFSMKVSNIHLFERAAASGFTFLVISKSSFQKNYS